MKSIENTSWLRKKHTNWLIGQKNSNEFEKGQLISKRINS